MTIMLGLSGGLSMNIAMESASELCLNQLKAPNASPLVHKSATNVETALISVPAGDPAF